MLRGLHTAIVDEADSILIDEAVTPLIISASRKNEMLREVGQTAVRMADTLERGADYRLDARYREVELPEAGRRKMRHVGRGSAANSLVSHLLGFTAVDPLAHNLLFERFMNPARTSPPDIDLDFSWRERDGLLRWVFERGLPFREAHLPAAERAAEAAGGWLLGARAVKLDAYLRALREALDPDGVMNPGVL